jgi:hypothetical protein
LEYKAETLNEPLKKICFWIFDRGNGAGDEDMPLLRKSFLFPTVFMDGVQIQHLMMENEGAGSPDPGLNFFAED